MLRIRNWAANFETHESRKLKRLDWVSVPNDLQDLGYRMLIDHSDGATHFAAWIIMVEIGSTCKTRGTLMENGVSLTPRHLSLKSGLSAALFAAAIPRLLEIGWLEDIPESGRSADAPEESPAIPADHAGGAEEIRQAAGKTSAYIDSYSYIDSNTKPCASNSDARDGVTFSIDDPPFETTSPDALFPVKTTPVAKRASQMSPGQEGWFAAWWPEYWRHVAKKAAREAFRKQVRTVARFEQVMTATRAQKAEMLGREENVRPHGATWLHGERWADETAEVAPTDNAVARILEEQFRVRG
jgi:hypothetical protein